MHLSSSASFKDLRLEMEKKERKKRSTRFKNRDEMERGGSNRICDIYSLRARVTFAIVLVIYVVSLSEFGLGFISKPAIPSVNDDSREMILYMCYVLFNFCLKAYLIGCITYLFVQSEKNTSRRRIQVEEEEEGPIGEGEEMAAVEVEAARKAEDTWTANSSSSIIGKQQQGEGLRQYYLQHIHELQLQIRQKTHNLNRLEAQRNDLNSRVRMLREELQLLQESGSYVGEVVKVMGKNKVLAS